MSQKNKILSYSNSYLGSRKHNEDSYNIEVFEDLTIAAIADGVGGRNCGALASKFCIDSFHLEVRQNRSMDLKNIVTKINKGLLKLGLESPNCAGMATTFTACVVSDNILKGIHIGDTRVCVLRKNGIKELTIEHSEGARLRRLNLITSEQFYNYPRKHIIEGALGIGDNIDSQSFEFHLQKKDRIILSTDGFHNNISKLVLRNLSVQNLSPEQFFQSLETELIQKKLTDNATFILLEII